MIDSEFKLMFMQSFVFPRLKKEDVTFCDTWIHVKDVGTIGMYKRDKHAIGLDYSMKWIVGTNESIPCTASKWDQYALQEEVKEKVVALFRGALPNNPSENNHGSSEQE